MSEKVPNWVDRGIVPVHFVDSRLDNRTTTSQTIIKYRRRVSSRGGLSLPSRCRFHQTEIRHNQAHT